MIKPEAFIGMVATGHAGLGFFPSTQIDKAWGKQRQKLIQEEVQANVEDKRICKMVGLNQQGEWKWWENFFTVENNLVRDLAL